LDVNLFDIFCERALRVATLKKQSRLDGILRRTLVSSNVVGCRIKKGKGSSVERVGSFGMIRVKVHKNSIPCCGFYEAILFKIKICTSEFRKNGKTTLRKASANLLKKFSSF